jgi:membrane-bound metal-dependent hydrolase YbcI (DUF457 family)
VPFTAFHAGPGLLLKGAAPRAVSLAAFVATQVAVDLEPLWFILRGEYPVHRWTHTFAVGGAIGLIVGAALHALARRWSGPAAATLRADLALGAALIGGLLGGVSHAWLDGLMHRDVRALRPFAETTWVLSPAGVTALHIGCAVAGLFGVLVMLVRRARA